MSTSPGFEDGSTVTDLQGYLYRRYGESAPGEAPLGSFGRVTKRIIDVVSASAGLLVLGIPFLLIIFAIKIDSRGAIFFTKPRVGQAGRMFTPLKFRTMVDQAINKGDGFTVSRHDPRITRVGRFLRSWSLDELPQLINVFLGTMSLVGPRPAWPHEVLQFDSAQMGRLRLKPGITGFAAINGRNAVPWVRRLELDNWYIDHWSVWLDLKVIFITPIKILSKEGIYGPDGTNLGMPSLNLPEVPPSVPGSSVQNDDESKS